MGPTVSRKKRVRQVGLDSDVNQKFHCPSFVKIGDFWKGTNACRTQITITDDPQGCDVFGLSGVAWRGPRFRSKQLVRQMGADSDVSRKSDGPSFVNIFDFSKAIHASMAHIKITDDPRGCAFFV